MKWQGERMAWLCPACGQTYPAESEHNHNRIVCGHGELPDVPPGRKPVPELDRWLEEHKP